MITKLIKELAFGLILYGFLTNTKKSEYSIFLGVSSEKEVNKMVVALGFLFKMVLLLLIPFGLIFGFLDISLETGVAGLISISGIFLLEIVGLGILIKNDGVRCDC